MDRNDRWSWFAVQPGEDGVEDAVGGTGLGEVEELTAQVCRMPMCWAVVTEGFCAGLAADPGNGASGCLRPASNSEASRSRRAQNRRANPAAIPHRLPLRVRSISSKALSQSEPTGRIVQDRAGTG